ncbi:MAG: PAS domain S-box protein, partial [Nitrospinaceae bacterium]|nr:PAS domain S-box protein [Nitrospinaceae bacterium]
MFEQQEKIEARARWTIGMGSLLFLLFVMVGRHWYGRIQGEESLTREFLRSVVNDAADGIIFTNQDREILFWNSAAEALYGYTQDEALGQSVLMLAHSERREDVLNHVHDVLTTGEAVSYETDRMR